VTNESRDNRCKARVMVSGWRGGRQCFRHAAKDGFCKCHHPDAVKARDAASLARYEARNPFLRLQRAREKLSLAIRRLQDNGIFADDLRDT